VEVHLTFIGETGEENITLLENLVDISLHVLAVESVAEERELALHEGEGSVIDNVLAEDRDSEVVNLTGSQNLVGSVVHELVTFGADNESDTLGENLGAEDGTVLEITVTDELNRTVSLHAELARKHRDEVVKARGKVRLAKVIDVEIQRGEDNNEGSQHNVFCM
jgi:hypothetical protein